MRRWWRAIFALHSPFWSQLLNQPAVADGGHRRVALENLMTGTFRLGTRRLGLWVWALAFVAILGLVPAYAEPVENVTVSVDQAKVMKLPANVATIVIGNPLIADATLQSAGILVITGKGYGETNMLALDRQGEVVMTRMVRVLGPTTRDMVVVYKGGERESYSCAPECERRITLGDSPTFFSATLGQASARSSQAGHGK
jgi:Pilus formation protein N terminal region